MKLIRLIMNRMTLVLALILFLWSLAFYVNMSNRLYHIVDAGLQAFANNKISEYLISPEPSFSLLQDTTGVYTYTIVAVPDAYALANYGTSFRNQSEKSANGERAHQRNIRTIFQDRNEQYYQFSAWVSTADQEQFRHEALYWVVFLYLFLLSSIIAINYHIVEKNMRPLYHLLQWIDRFDVQKKPEPLDNPTRITEFQKLNQAVSLQFQRSAQLYVQQKEFVDNAAHEMQTPVAVCLNQAEQFLQRPDLTEGQMQEILKLQSTLRRLSRLQKDMLQLSRIENGAYTGLEEVNFVELFNETTHDLNEIFAYKDIRCRLEGESELKASAHPALCQLLVANLCRNAYVHTPQAGTLRIVWGNKDFSVCNTGPKALDSSHIFQRFYKDSSNPSSTGLGLSLCQAICQQYHWPITYSYKNGEHIFHVALCPHPNS